MNHEEFKAMLESNKTKADTGDEQAAYGVAALSLMFKDYDTAFKYANQSVLLSGGQNHESLNILGDLF
jgi:hypothetical protein